MHTQILRRVGIGLVLAGLLTACLISPRGVPGWSVALGVNALALTACVFLLGGNARAARLVRAAAAVALGASAMGLAGWLVIRPLDLVLTELRLDPISFLRPGLTAATAVCAAAWVVWELGRTPVQAAIAGAGSWRWNAAASATAGAGGMFVAALLLWLTLHGESAALATSLARQQLGPDYRYALTSIASERIDGRTSVSGIVTAWNGQEIRTIVLHWQAR